MCTPTLIYAQQENKGVRFVQGLSWQQVKAKAKAENKYIFMDLYATWCIPCKKMDKEVYSNDTLGNYINERFISVKVQMDSTGKDNQEIKRWYTDAHQLKEEYDIPGYPSFLFFAPDGKLVYKDLGYKTVPDLIGVADKALNPQNLIYYSRLEDYKKGKKDYPTMSGLAIFVNKLIGDNELAQKIAADYIRNADKRELLTKENILLIRDVAKNSMLADSLAGEYKENHLDKLSEQELCTHENLDFIKRFSYLVNSKDNIFQLWYLKPEKVDSVLEFKGAADLFVQQTISREELRNRLFENGKPLFENPDWNYLGAIIKEKYPKVDVKSLILDYQISYYKKLKDWSQWAKYQDQKVDKLIKTDAFKTGNAWTYYELNLPAWDAFLHCNDKEVLKKALNWSNLSIKLGEPNPNCLDTRANLLYKLGRRNEAIAQQRKAIKLSMTLSSKEGVNMQAAIKMADGFKKTLKKMKKGESTYLEEGAVWDVNTLHQKE